MTLSPLSRWLRLVNISNGFSPLLIPGKVRIKVIRSALLLSDLEWCTYKYQLTAFSSWEALRQLRDKLTGKLAFSRGLVSLSAGRGSDLSKLIITMICDVSLTSVLSGLC